MIFYEDERGNGTAIIWGVAIALTFWFGLYASAHAQQPAKDRKDYLIDVMQASTIYSNNIAANCFADVAKQMDELKSKIKELEDKLNTDKK